MSIKARLNQSEDTDFRIREEEFRCHGLMDLLTRFSRCLVLNSLISPHFGVLSLQRRAIESKSSELTCELVTHWAARQLKHFSYTGCPKTELTSRRAITDNLRNFWDTLLRCHVLEAVLMK